MKNRNLSKHTIPELIALTETCERPVHNNHKKIFSSQRIVNLQNLSPQEAVEISAGLLTTSP